MSNYASEQHPNFFEFPPHPAGDFSSAMYPPNSTFLSPTPNLPPYQLCELIYTPVTTPNGVALTPSLVAISSMEGPPMYNPAPSPIPPAPTSYGRTQMKIGDMVSKECVASNRVRRDGKRDLTSDY